MVGRDVGRLSLLLAAAVTVCILGVPSLASAAILYDQTDTVAGGATSSQEFSDVPASSDQTADDFTVPNGQFWAISEVDTLGLFTGSGSPPPVNVFIYANAGALPGAKLFTQRDIAATGGPDYDAPLTGAPLLGPGTYWISVQAHGPSAPTWNWHNRTTQSGSPAAWQNPGGGIPTAQSCTSWGVRSTCLGVNSTSPDQAFKLLGSLQPLPSNQFSFGKVKLNKKKGTAKLTVNVPGPGALILSGKQLKTSHANARATGAAVLRVKPKGKLKRKLKKRHKAKVKLSVSFTPTGGTPHSQSKKIKLKLKGPHHHRGG